MATIHQLPNEILDLIIKYFIKFEQFDHEMTLFHETRNPPKRIRASKLRLVCKRWENIITNQGHPFERLVIKLPRDYMDFIEIISNRPSLPPRCCLNLTLYSPFWSDSLIFDEGWEGMTALMKFFSKTAVTLQIELCDYNAVHPAVTEQLSSMENLREIKLTSGQLPYVERLEFERWGLLPHKQPLNFHFCWIAPFITANHRLTSLEISSIDCSFPTDFRSQLATSTIPAITQLSFNLGDGLIDGILGLCYAVKSSLKALTINGKPDRSQLALFIPLFTPFFEDFRHTLEGLSLDCVNLINQIKNLTFPKLRICMMSRWIFGNDSPSGFGDSPIEVLVLKDEQRYGQKFQELDPPPQAFLKLRKLILVGTLEPPENLSQMCQEGGVELVCLLACDPHDFLSSSLGLIDRHGNI